jgi:pilus assembly protein CpaC
VKSRIYKNEHKSKSSTAGKGLAWVMAAVLIVALSPVCLAQDMMPIGPSAKPPVVTPPSAAPPGTVPPSAQQSAPEVEPPRLLSGGSSIPGTMSSISRAASDGKTLHITVGHSIFIDTKTRLRRVYVADPSVLNSVTLTPNEIIVTAMSAGISSLTLLDDFGQAQNYFISADLDIDGLRTAMAQEVRGAAVKVQGSGARVTLSGTVPTDAIADAAMKLASLYSKDVASSLIVTPNRAKQVRLEVRILEVDRVKALQLGINLFSPGGNTNFIAQTTTSQFPSSATLGGSSTTNTLATLTTSSPLNFMLYAAKLNLGATIQDLQNKSVLQILAEPTITTISGVKAEFLSGGEFPFPMVQPGGTGGAPVVTISFRPYGVKLEFTPTVNDDGTIRLKVAPEVSALDYANAVAVSGFTVPALSTRKADTEVELRSNQSFAISGLLDQRTSDIMSKNPGAANIPILGALFKSKSSTHSATELIVVVTPTVVDPLTETTEPIQPDLPIRTLDTGGFDKSLGKNLNPQPTAPPLNPDKPHFGGQAPVAAPPASTTPTADDATPASDPQSPPATAPAPPVVASPAAVASASAPADAGTEQPRAAHVPTGPIVEIMALSHESDAEAMVAALNRHGYVVSVKHDPNNSLLHLKMGPFESTSEAETMRRKLLLDGYNATIK